MNTGSNSRRIRAVLIDLSGTLHIGEEAIPGARDALDRLRTSGRKVKFLTNTSTKSSQRLLEQLNRPSALNFSISRDELVTSVLATAKYVQRLKLRPLCLMEDTTDLTFDLPTHGDDANAGDAAIENTTEDAYDSVVVGLAPSHFHYRRLNHAFRILLSHPNNLIAIHRGNYLRDTDGELSMGPGAFVTALETASGCLPAIVMGKPSRSFFESALWDDVPPEETCMIGDDVLGDCQGALRVGIGTAILVQTGKYRPGDEDKLEQEEVGGGNQDGAFVVCASIVEAIDFILKSDM